LLTVVIVTLLAVRATHAGALWRDECAVVQLSRMPSISDVVRNFQHEAFPPLFPLTIRAYTNLFGVSDTVLRVFGFCVGCLVVAAFWASSALFRNRVPLAALGLLSLNTTFFEWGTTVRGYGLGSALIVLAFGCLGSLLVEPRRGRLVTATIACFLAVQVLLYNTVLLLAISGAATAVLLFQRNFKRAFVLAGISGAALVSFLPYLPAYLRARDWNILVRGAPSFYSLWKHAEVALGNPGYSIPALWYSIVLGLAGVFILRMWSGRREQSVAGHERIWFALIVCGFSVAGCFVFLRILSYTTSAWYYLALICLLAAALDSVASALCTTTSLRLVRLGFASAALVAAPFADWSAITERHTNVDVAARAVTERAAPNDLIVVSPWPFGISFQRYYSGTAPWITIPNIADHRVHRYDLMKAKMISSHPVEDVADAIRKALMSGNRVWFVGGLNLPSDEDNLMSLPPAPASRFKWDTRAYTASWWQELSVLAILHASRVDPVTLPVLQNTRTNDLEQTSLVVVQGWH
jgi:hypothetical protein